MGRTWPGEWNQLVMDVLKKREQQQGRRLTVAEIMREVEKMMNLRDIPLQFVPYRGK